MSEYKYKVFKIDANRLIFHYMKNKNFIFDLKSTKYDALNGMMNLQDNFQDANSLFDQLWMEIRYREIVSKGESPKEALNQVAVDFNSSLLNLHENEIIDALSDHILILDLSSIYDNETTIKSHKEELETLFSLEEGKGLYLEFEKPEGITEKIHFVRFTKSNSMTKSSMITFIDANYRDAMKKRLTLTCDKDDQFYNGTELKIKETGIVPSKLYAYTGLSLSSGYRIDLDLDETKVIVLKTAKDNVLTPRPFITSLDRLFKTDSNECYFDQHKVNKEKANELIFDICQKYFVFSLAFSISKEKQYDIGIFQFIKECFCFKKVNSNSLKSYATLCLNDLCELFSIKQSSEVDHKSEYRNWLVLHANDISSQEITNLSKTEVAEYFRKITKDILSAFGQYFKEYFDYKAEVKGKAMIKLTSVSPIVGDYYDGEGLISDKYCELVNSKYTDQTLLKNGKKHHSFQFRLPMIKGMLHCANFSLENGFYHDHIDDFVDVDHPYGKILDGSTDETIQETYESVYKNEAILITREITSYKCTHTTKELYFVNGKPLRSICKTVKGKKVFFVLDMFNFYRDISKVEIILTEGQLKLFNVLDVSSFQSSLHNKDYSMDLMKVYFQNFRSMNHMIYITQSDTIERRNDGKIRFNYQHLISADLSKSDIEELIKSDVDYLTILKSENPCFRNDYGEDKETENEDDINIKRHSTKKEKLNALLKANPNCKNLSFMKDEINNAYKETLLEIGKGRFSVDGEVRLLSADLLYLLYFSIDQVEQMAAKNVCLPLDYVYAPGFNSHSIRKNENIVKGFSGVVMMRNPHITKNENVVSFFLHENDAAKKERDLYFGKLDGVCMLNPSSWNQARLGGADFDGDLVFMISDKIIFKHIFSQTKYSFNGKISISYSKYPTIDIGSCSADKCKSINGDLYLSDVLKTLKNSFSNKVGIYTNSAFKTLVYSLFHSEDMSDDILMNKRKADLNVQEYLITIGQEIDSAKHGNHPIPPNPVEGVNDSAEFLLAKHFLKNKNEQFKINGSMSSFLEYAKKEGSSEEQINKVLGSIGVLYLPFIMEDINNNIKKNHIRTTKQQRDPFNFLNKYSELEKEQLDVFTEILNIYNAYLKLTKISHVGRWENANGVIYNLMRNISYIKYSESKIMDLFLDNIKSTCLDNKNLYYLDFSDWGIDKENDKRILNDLITDGGIKKTPLDEMIKALSTDYTDYGTKILPLAVLSTKRDKNMDVSNSNYFEKYQEFIDMKKTFAGFDDDLINSFAFQIAERDANIVSVLFMSPYFKEMKSFLELVHEYYTNESIFIEQIYDLYVKVDDTAKDSSCRAIPLETFSDLFEGFNYSTIFSLLYGEQIIFSKEQKKAIKDFDRAINNNSQKIILKNNFKINYYRDILEGFSSDTKKLESKVKSLIVKVSGDSENKAFEYCYVLNSQSKLQKFSSSLLWNLFENKITEFVLKENK